VRLSEAAVSSIAVAQQLNEVNKPLHPSTNAEILVKIGPLSYELPGLECWPLKNNIKKNIGRIYSPLGVVVSPLANTY